METLLPVQSNTLYEALKNCEQVDLRDNRGKVHCVGLVLMGVIIGLYRNRDGVLSGIHRSLTNTHAPLCHYLGIENTTPISRAQLPILLKKIDPHLFAKLLFDFAGMVLSEQEKQWFAADGKELRGTIAKGEKRGEAVVQVVSHANRQVYGQGFYNGQKESKRPCIQQVLEAGLGNQKITLDALHFIPETIKQIAYNQGIYLVGLKENQKQLYDDMVKVSQNYRPLSEGQTLEKGHGRIDKRTYKSYDIKDEFFDERWAGANFQTLVEVKRETFQCKTKAESKEVSYYVSNEVVRQGNSKELFGAVRGHWSVETNNHIRDVTFREDDLQTKEPVISKVMACCRTLALTFLNKLKLKNIKAKLEDFADNFDLLIKWMASINFL